MHLRIHKVFILALELINLVMQLRICLNQLFQGFIILFPRPVGVIEILFQNILALSLRLVLLLLFALIGDEVITDLREVGFEHTELLDE